jgi:7,8-dihydroneopterin aldolase/epimerase/oxygenase
MSQAFGGSADRLPGVRVDRWIGWLRKSRLFANLRGMADQILISQLCVSTFIGATEEERRRPQRLYVSLVLETRGGFAGIGDSLEKTIDYAVVAQEVKALAVRGERRLIETLAEDIAGELLRAHPLAAVEVEVRKHILPDTEFVGVRIRREAL